MNQEIHEDVKSPQSFSIMNGELDESEDLLCSKIHKNVNLISNDVSVVDENIVQKDNVISGIIWMLVFVLWITANHIMVKYLMVVHPYITAFDATYSVSIMASIIYYATGKIQGINMNILSLERNVIYLIILRIIIGILCNLFFLVSLSQIIISKAILIFSLNPIFWAILAAIILKEKLHFVTIISCIWATGGIYLLTLKSQNQDDEKSNILGYLLMIGASILNGSIFVWLRFIFRYEVNIWLVSYLTSFGFLIQSILFHIFFPSLYNFEKYLIYDLVFFFFIALSTWSANLLMAYASKITKVSRIAPLSNLENILTIVFDIFIFNYSFFITDGLGMLIIFSSIGAHILSTTYYYK